MALSANLSDGSPNDAIHYVIRMNINGFESDIKPDGLSQRDEILAVSRLWVDGLPRRLFEGIWAE